MSAPAYVMDVPAGLTRRLSVTVEPEVSDFVDGDRYIVPVAAEAVLRSIAPDMTAAVTTAKAVMRCLFEKRLRDTLIAMLYLFICKHYHHFIYMNTLLFF